MGKHMNKQERAEHRSRKLKEQRRGRRRMKMWFDQQSRVYTDSSNWDETAKEDENVEQYRNKVNRDCGMFNEEFETGKSTFKKLMQKEKDTWPVG